MSDTFGLITQRSIQIAVAMCALWMGMLPPYAAVAQTAPPTETIVDETFNPLAHQWRTESGTWSVSGGTFISSAAGARDITTIASYRAPDPQSPPTSKLQFDRFTIRARMFNPGSNGQAVGIVYHYQDAANYHEVRYSNFSDIGELSVRNVIGGNVSKIASTSRVPLPPGTWFEIEVQWDRDRIVAIKLDGELLPFGEIFQGDPAALSAGRIGLITDGTTGGFDDVRVEVPSGDQFWLERLSDGMAQGWMPQSGQWAVSSGTYNGTTVAATSVTLAPIHTEERRTATYSMRVRMLNPFGASGNLVGIVFNYRSPTEYSELVFSPTGIAKINNIAGGVRTTLASAPYNGRRNVWFDVLLENDFGVSVRVDGQKVFADVPANPNDFALGGVGLITHWAPGRFDDIRFVHGTIRAEVCLQTFGGELDRGHVVNGAWDTLGGTLNRTTVRALGIAVFCRGGLDVTYRMKLRNEFGASGNLVGLVYNYQSGGTNFGDYYEALFSTTGTALLRKVIRGVPTIVARGTHGVPAHEWFTVELIRDGFATTVKVDGDAVIEEVIQGELNAGHAGAITHWTLGHFDDFSAVQHAPR